MRRNTENMLEIKKVSVTSAELAYVVFNSGEIDLVIEMGLGAVIGEWRQLAQRLSKTHTVLLYERAGYGSSGDSKLERTPENIAVELYRLLRVLECRPQVTLLAHSQGGLYAQKFARMYPQCVNRLILLDPLSPLDYCFREALTDAEFRKSGVDKTKGLQINRFLAKFHLGWLIRKVMRTAPPFYYCDTFSQEEKEYILASCSKPRAYETALAEYQFAHDPRCLQGLAVATAFPSVPLVLVTHDSEMEVREIRDFGGATETEAWKIERLWQELMKVYLTFSGQSVHEYASKSSHYIHLTDADLICALINN